MGCLFESVHVIGREGVDPFRQRFRPKIGGHYARTGGPNDWRHLGGRGNGDGEPALQELEELVRQRVAIVEIGWLEEIDPDIELIQIGGQVCHRHRRAE